MLLPLSFTGNQGYDILPYIFVHPYSVQCLLLYYVPMCCGDLPMTIKVKLPKGDI